MAGHLGKDLLLGPGLVGRELETRGGRVTHKKELLREGLEAFRVESTLLRRLGEAEVVIEGPPLMGSDF
jgi:hypothetical protein